MSPMRFLSRSLFVLGLLSFALVSASLGQVSEVNNSTSTPIPGTGHDYIRMLNETVNPANGSVSLRIQVPVSPGRRLTLPFAFGYDSSGAYAPQGDGNGNVARTADGDYLNEAGWSYVVPLQGNMVLGINPDPVTGKPTCDLSTGYVFSDTRGSRYQFTQLLGVDKAPNFCTGGADRTPDSTSNPFYSASLTETGFGACGQSVTVTDLRNTRYSFPGQGCTPQDTPMYTLPSSIEDRNGNIVTVAATSSGFSVTDTLGRTVLATSGFGTTGNTITVSGLAQPYTVTWGTTTAPYEPGVTSHSPSNLGCATAMGNAGTNPVVAAIALPNGQQFQFSYDSTYGLLSKITYPGGGYISYSWAPNTQSEFGAFTGPNNSPQACTYTYDNAELAHRYVSFDGVTIAEQQDFSYAPTTWNPNDFTVWTSKQTTVTTHDLVRGTSFQTIYTYTPVSVPNASPDLPSHFAAQIPMEQTIVYKDTSGNTLRTVNKTWYNQYEIQSEQTTLDNGQTSQVNYTWSNGLITEKDEYDFGQTTPTRKTTYQYVGGFDQPSQTVVYSANGNRIAETDVSFDGSSTAAVSNLPPGTHDETNYSYNSGTPRGNATTVTKLCLQSCANAVTTFKYDETGQVLSSTDACGNATCSDMSGANHTTAFSYGDSYTVLSGGQNSAYSYGFATDAFLTNITDALGHTQSFSYDFNNGQLTVLRDQNNQTTSYLYNDSFGRPTQTNYPDGGTTTLSYNDSPYSPSTPSPSVTTTKQINSSTNFVTLSALDGLGHAVRTEVTSDPQGTVYTDTAYDGLGRVYTVSNPYRSGTDPTTSSGTTTYIYDALGRKCLEIPQDGTAVSANTCPATAPAKDIFTQYSGPTTTVTDETGRKRQSTTDGLGRLIQVVEDPGGLGYVTNYTVDTLGNLTQVVQNGSHTRTFNYDSLARLLCASNPENSFAGCPTVATNTYTSGTVGYSYDANSNVAGKTVTGTQNPATPGSGSGTASGSEQSIAGAPATSGTGTVTFAGTLQSKQVLSQAATAGAGSVTFGGSLQSKQIQTQGATAGTGSVSISGNERSKQVRCPLHCTTIFDTGTLTITVNGHSDSASYAEGDTTSSVASYLVTAINSDSAAPVSASLNGSTVYLASKATGASSNYSLSTSFQNNSGGAFTGTSFTPTPSGSALTGGANATYTTLYDSGTCTITVNSHGDSASWSGSGTTVSSIASAIASGIGGDGGAFVNASASGGSVTLTARTTGAGTNYSLSSSCSYDSTDFSGPSFSTSNSGSALTGGQNATYNTVYDSGTSTITVNGHGDTTSWSGSGTTTSSIASSLVSVINADSGAYVTASASGATVNLTAKTAGASTNYTLSSSGTYDSSDFSSSSFSSSNSGSALTGGHDAGATTYDSGSVWITLNGTQYSVSYGQSSSSSSLASSLASAISAGSLANASASGSGISITAKTTGSSTNYSLSSGSSTSQPGSFSSPSFSISVSGSSLAGGADSSYVPIVTSYTYDALNRVTQKTYSDGTPSAFFAYDGPTNGFGVPATNLVGRLSEEWAGTSCCASQGGEIFSYDPTGRVVNNTQYTPNTSYLPVSYTYDLAGNMTSVTYPSGRAVNYTYDGAGRPATATDSANGITYATAQSSPPAGCTSLGVCYTPQGTEYSSAIGVTSAFAGVNFSETYNTRLQPLEIKAFSAAGNAIDITYSFADPTSGGNAGHVNTITNNLNSNRSQSFAYDSLNRITSAGTAATSGAYCWGYQYNYDAWGNLLAQAGWSPNYNGCSEATMGSVNADASNHISAFIYDLRGNTPNDGSIAYTYDAESRITSASGVTYAYDAEGRRVSKSTGKNYAYELGGEVLAELNNSGSTTAEYIFFAGRRIAMLPAGGSAEYYVEDMLGSSRVMTANSGAVCYDADFDPYGGEHSYTNTCSQNYKFEGKERDAETGNDDFGARYYSNRYGRWLSSDWSAVPVPVPYANLTNPQTLNLYAMVADDPESFADLDGHDSDPDPGQQQDNNSAQSSDHGPGGPVGPQPQVSQGNQQAQETKDKKPDSPQTDNDKKPEQPRDPQQTPLDAGSGSGGGQGRQPRGGEKGKTSKPDNPRKHSRPSKDHPGQWEVQDHQTGKWVLKPKGWSPATQRVILGVEVGVTAYVIYRVVRMLPSLAPPLWETIPLNAALP